MPNELMVAQFRFGSSIANWRSIREGRNYEPFQIPNNTARGINRARPAQKKTLTIQNLIDKQVFLCFHYILIKIK